MCAELSVAVMGLAAMPRKAGAPRPWPYSCGDKRHREGAGLDGAGCGVAPVASTRPMPQGISRVTTTRYQMSPGKGVAKGTEHPRLKTELKSTIPGLSEVTTGPSSAVRMTSVFLEGHRPGEGTLKGRAPRRRQRPGPGRALRAGERCENQVSPASSPDGPRH